MSNLERTGRRNLLYSKWHRPASLRRFMSARDADSLAAIDIDFIEYCKRCGLPVAAVETQQSKRPPKDANVTVALCQMADNLPCYSISYIDGPAEGADDVLDGRDVVHIRAKRLWPLPSLTREFTPEEWARHLLSLRGRCRNCSYDPFAEAS